MPQPKHLKIPKSGETEKEGVFSEWKGHSPTHRFPVTVYVLEGAFTLELDGRAPITVKAGEAMVEPPKVAMTGYNRSATELTKVIIFYVSANDTPFLDLLH